jgi:3-hydroxybutyryl-CoA dehydratase
MKISVGDELVRFRVARVDPQVMQAWAEFLQDPNPIHLDPAVVRAKGLGDRVINQGPCNLAFVISMLQAALPGSSLESLDIRYVDNVYGGDAVEAGGKVTGVTRVPGGSNCVCEVWLRAEGRGPVISGTAVLTVPA